MANARCNVCDEEIMAGLKVQFGQRLNCPACKAVLEVVGLDPIEVDWLYFDQNVGEDVYSELNRVAECPLCQNDINITQRLRLGQCVMCPSCDVELEVVWLYPIELNWPYGESYLYVGDVLDDYDFIGT